MKRVFIIGVVIALLAGLVISSLALAQANGFTDSFDDPSLPGWETSGNVSMEGGMLVLEAGGEARRLDPWGDSSSQLRMMLEGEVALKLGFRTGSNQGYYVLIDRQELVFLREEAGVSSELAAAPFPLGAGEWVTLGWSSSGGIVTVSLNELEVIRVQDPAPLPPGGFMLRGEGAGAAFFDELVVLFEGGTSAIEPDSPVPQTEAPPAPTEGITGEGGSPANQNLPWIRTGGPIGGLGYDIRYNFDDPNIWYVTDAYSGFHISTDDGKTWNPSNAGINISPSGPGGPISVFSATVDPNNSNIIWVGTSGSGQIFKSTDGGYNWEERDAGVSVEFRPGLSFRGLTVDPNDSDTVYAMGEIASFSWTGDGSERKGAELDMTQGIVYKTTDGGLHWEQVWRGDNLARYAWIDPRDSNVVYVSTGIFDRESASTDVERNFAGGVGILKSRDGGATWDVIDQDQGLADLYIGSLFMHPEDPDTLYAAGGMNFWSGVDPNHFTKGIYRTRDGGESWEFILAGDPTLKHGGWGENITSVEVCTSDPNVVYAAGDIAVYRSDDGGDTWEQYSRVEHTWGPPGIIAGFAIDIQCDPRDPMRVFVNNYLGGNFLSEDGGKTWSLASKGYTGALVTHVEAVPDQPWIVYVGSRTGVFRSYNGGEDWTGISQVVTKDHADPNKTIWFALNEVAGLAVDPQDSAHVIAAPMIAKGIAYSYDAGQNWTHSEFPEAPFPPLEIKFAPSNPEVVYAAVSPSICRFDAGMMPPEACNMQGFDMYRSSDRGDSWGKVEGRELSGIGVMTLAVAPDDENNVYVGTYSQGLFTTFDGGVSWNQHTLNESSQPIIALAVDPTNTNVLFAGLAEGGIYRSEDAGETWTQMVSGIPPEGTFKDIVIDPSDSANVYAADKFEGVYFSSDGGMTWALLRDGLAHYAAHSLSISVDGTTLYVGISGDGVYRLGTPAGEPPLEPAYQESGAPNTSGNKADEAQGEGKGSGLPCPGGVVPLAVVALTWLGHGRGNRKEKQD